MSFTLYKRYCGGVDASYAIIADIIGSRHLPDRAGAQRTFLAALDRAAQGLGLPRPPYASVGDEFQAVAATLGDALILTLRTHLLLPPGHDLRFGVGQGDAVELDGARGAAGAPIQDGSAWWAARDAIEHAHALQDRGNLFARTWLRCSPRAPGGRGGREQPGGGGQAEGPGDRGLREREAVVNSLLLLRDHAVARLQPRQRRMMAGLILGERQVEIARAEKVSQQAVSDLARGAGAALLESHRLLEGLGATGAAPAGGARSGGRR
nr:SatD family protein [Actinomyces bowdenii]